MNDIEDRVLQTVDDELNTDCSLADKFVEDLGADSLDMEELIISLEMEFDIEISHAEMRQLSTVQSAVDLVRSKRC